jgi:hypothetical protein
MVTETGAVGAMATASTALMAAAKMAVATDDLKRKSGSTVTVLRSQRFSDEFGQIVIWTHHTAARDYTWSVAVSQLYGA